MLGRTAPGSSVRVGGEAVTVCATGVFVRDCVPLALGFNSIRIEATTATGQTLERLLEIERVAPPPGVAWPDDRLWLDGSSLRSAEILRVAPGEPVQVAVHAKPGQQVQARLPWHEAWQAPVEHSPAVTPACCASRPLLMWNQHPWNCAWKALPCRVVWLRCRSAT